MQIKKPDKRQISFFCFAFALLANASLAAGEESQTTKTEGKAETSAAAPDPFDFEKQGSAASGEEKFLETDDSIVLSFEPLTYSAVVDRVLDASTRVKIRAPGAIKVEVFLEAVDSPYCGKSTSEPKLLGTSSNQRSFEITWEGSESSRYVKVWALAYKKDGKTARSKSKDLSIGGIRFKADN